MSLDAQRDFIQTFAANNDIKITHWFSESATAAETGRPVFDEMLRQLRRGKAEGVVVHKIDRSARNYFDWGWLSKLADAGVAVHFAGEGLDFSSRSGRLAANVQMVVAEDYCRNLRAEIRKGQEGLLKRGFYPFKAPIGYLNNGKGRLKTLDPARAPLVSLAFELYASGQYSIRSLLTEINRRGLRNHNGKPISKGCLEKILKNPFYTGIIKIRRTGAVYRGKHEPLISVALFQSVQDTLAGKYNKKVTCHNLTYRGLFRCGSCQRAMIPEKQKGYVYYRCQAQDCPRNCVREERLEEKISSKLFGVKFSAEHIAAIEDAVRQWGASGQQATSSRTYTLQLAQIDSRIEKLTDLLLDDTISKETYNARREKLLLEQKQLQKKLEEGRRKRACPAKVERFLERVKSLAEHYDSADPDERRRIAELFTSNRSVLAKNVDLQLPIWLQDTQNAVDVLSCADRRPNNRRSSEAHEAHIETLARLASSDKAKELESIFADNDDANRIQW